MNKSHSHNSNSEFNVLLQFHDNYKSKHFITIIYSRNLILPYSTLNSHYGIKRHVLSKIPNKYLNQAA